MLSNLMKVLGRELEEIVVPYKNEIEFGDLEGPIYKTENNFDIEIFYFNFMDMMGSSNHAKISYNNSSDLIDWIYPTDNSENSEQGIYLFEKKNLIRIREKFKERIKEIPVFRRKKFKIFAQNLPKKFNTLDDAFLSTKKDITVTDEELNFVKKAIKEVYVKKLYSIDYSQTQKHQTDNNKENSNNFLAYYFLT